MKQKEIPYEIRLRMQQAKSNSYHKGYSDGYQEAMKLVKDTERVVKNCDKAVANIKNHYQFIIDSLDKATNNQFSKIRFDYGEGDAGRSKSWITLNYYHSGEYRCITRLFKSGHRFTNIEFVNICNELLEKMIKNHSREVKNGGS